MGGCGACTTSLLWVDRSMVLFEFLLCCFLLKHSLWCTLAAARHDMGSMCTGK